MKNFLPILVVGILVLSGLGACALYQDNLESVSETAIFEEPITNSFPRDYTHTVLVEVGTATWCPSCPASNSAWHTIYGGGNYDFEYTELVSDMNSVANSRFSQFNPKWVPTSYWDGGEYVYPGTNTGIFYSYLDGSGSRIVPDLVASLDALWLGGADIEISYTVDNNDANDYGGRIRIYVIELESTLWDDYSGNPYWHAFLDFAENKAINIPAAGSISDTFTWDGSAAGYPSITKDNIQVILAVFGDEGHTSYSDPPSGNPFTAYYSDECIAVKPNGGSTNEPPEAPTIDGPTSGSKGTEYTYTFNSVDPDGDDVFYYILWGDGYKEIWKGPHASGADASFAHTYDREGTFEIQAKAKDTYDAESDWGTFTVTMPRNKATVYSVFHWFFERFPLLGRVISLL